jgi:hypothetical protein
MPSQMTDTTENETTPLAAIELRYELAKRRIADVAVPAPDDSPVHDTVTVDVRLTQALIPARRKTEGSPAPVAQAPQRARRYWRSLRMPRWVGRGLPAS